MIEINDFVDLYRVSRYRIADCWDYPRKEAESDREYLKRKEECLRRRAGSKWLIMYKNGELTMHSQKRNSGDTYAAIGLDDYLDVGEL